MRFQAKVKILNLQKALCGLFVATIALQACSPRPQQDSPLEFSKNWYGKSYGQLQQLNLPFLHRKGLNGKGIKIAHFDSGFDGLPEIKALAHSFAHYKKEHGKDFVGGDAIDFQGEGNHGTETMSTVHSFLPGTYIGAAWEAQFFLARTEDGRSETHREEENWRMAVDWALEQGVDIITSSLQYNVFDEGEGDYAYRDMNGKECIVTKAAVYAARKGILVLCTQGNMGNSNWRFLTCPGDADSVLTVGAVTAAGKHAVFSGYGPSFDGRVKPDVVAQGQQTAVLNSKGMVKHSDGTSYSCPLMAGFCACLMQAFPEAGPQDIIEAVRGSGHLSEKPQKDLGYGIPNAQVAYEILEARF